MGAIRADTRAFPMKRSRRIVRLADWIAAHPDQPVPYPRIVHGTPVTPARLLRQLEGGSFCVSFCAPQQLERCMELLSAQSLLLLDNGAFTKWRQHQGPIDRERFWDWTNNAQELCELAVAVIPDVIDGCERQNWMEAAYAIRTPLSAFPERTMFIWHMNESIEQLVRAALLFNFVGIGSCAQFDVRKHPRAYLARLRHASAVIDHVELFYGRRPFVHLMRGLGILHRAVRCDSADSCNVARNHHRSRHRPDHVAQMAHRIEKKVRDRVRWIGPAYPTSNIRDPRPAQHPRWRARRFGPLHISSEALDWLQGKGSA